MLKKMKVKGEIDSLNFSSYHLEDYFLNEDDYIIEEVKGVGVFNHHRWIEEFKKSLDRNIIEGKILHTLTGITLPIKRFSVKKDKQTLEFAGLCRYDDKSKLLNELLQSLKEHIQDEVITRIDIAIDFKSKIPRRVIKNLKDRRKPFRWCNSKYFKTDGEKKKNYNINILLYPKHKKDNLDFELERLEFSFMGSYLDGKKLKDLPSLFQKITKTIKSFTGLEVEINPL